MAEQRDNKGFWNRYARLEDAAALSFADQTFDAVIISNALHIVSDPVKVLAGITRVLKPI